MLKIQKGFCLLFFICLIAACSPFADSSVGVPVPTYTPLPTCTPSLDTIDPQKEITEEVKAVIDMEVKGAIEQNLLLLESLYSPDAVVIDRNGTIHDTNDDRIIEGWENIKQQHYVGFFYFIGWKSMTLVDLKIEVSGNKAVAMHKGVVGDGEYFKDIGIYTLEKFDDRWLITQLEFRNE